MVNLNRDTRVYRVGISAIVRLVLCSILLSSSMAIAERYEPRLIDSLDALQFQTENAAEQKIASLIEDYPNSQAAHLMMSDLYAARAGIVNSDSHIATFQKPVDEQQLLGLRDEIRLRWNQIKYTGAQKQGQVPAAIIQLAPSKQSIIFVDAREARLYIYEHLNGELTLAVDNYTSIGEQGTHKQLEGDKRTPIGVYHVTRYIDDNELPPLYGSGAFPINYPNVLDKHYQRTGYGIWIHGTHPESFNRVPLASDGCVAMSNPEFEIIRPLIHTNQRTPVIISEQATWVKPEELLETRVLFHGLLDQWKQDWESLDNDRYLAHYNADKFFTKQSGYAPWANQKIATNTRKTQIEIDISELSLFAYPGETDTVVAQFTQDYHSNNYNSRSDIEQYWQRDAQGDWKIIFEGAL